MKKWPIALLLVCTLAGVLWYWLIAPQRKSQAATNPSQNASLVPAQRMPLSAERKGAEASTPTPSGREPVASGDAGGAVVTPPAASAQPFTLGSADSPPNMDAATVLSNMRVTVNQYRSIFGENPVGTNPEITKALNGDNPKQARLDRKST